MQNYLCTHARTRAHTHTHTHTHINFFKLRNLYKNKLLIIFIFVIDTKRFSYIFSIRQRQCVRIAQSWSSI